ncbi:flagellar basal body P-ring formation chaperone FlgA [Thiomicrospira sp.]|uniref:flagellar basal body P-ring formation chaperone FlgA n=1 Tax=Thiomicrospira sp. TaxID=935 RepID=UPI0025FC6515|nr:flagellar basal body P-ring formation chaperone FlgA [Thiomicrospira sp.]
MSQNQSLEIIHELVYEHVKQNIDQQIHEAKIDVRSLPSTLTLAQCNVPLELSQRDPHQIHGRLTVSVNCNTPSWRVFVSVNIDGKLPAIVSTQGILRQAVINKANVELKLVPLNEIRRGSMQSLDNVVGMRAKRAIPANRVITLQMLDIPYWVMEKDEVILVTRIGGIEIKTTGIALENGLQQDRVSVKNINSDIVVIGIVIAPNTVEVP